MCNSCPKEERKEGAEREGHREKEREEEEGSYLLRCVLSNRIAREPLNGIQKMRYETRLNREIANIALFLGDSRANDVRNAR